MRNILKRFANEMKKEEAFSHVSLILMAKVPVLKCRFLMHEKRDSDDEANKENQDEVIAGIKTAKDDNLKVIEVRNFSSVWRSFSTTNIQSAGLNVCIHQPSHV